MDRQYSEILKIPDRATYFWKNSPKYTLPLSVPYLGMGSSYFAPLAFKYMGINIAPEIASEFYNYLPASQRRPLGVIISQSGRSTEALWCAMLFENYIAVSNYADSALCTAANTSEIIVLLADDEQYSSSNTYINTLLVLFKGFGYDVNDAIELLVKQMLHYEAIGSEMADQVYELITKENIHGIYITGSGPNIGTAMQAALILSESTKINFNGLSMAQYDHGPKETAKNSIVIQILAKGKSYQRGTNLNATIIAAGGHVFTIEEPLAKENYSVLHNIIPFNFMAYYLAKKLNIKETFTVGGKVTEVR